MNGPIPAVGTVAPPLRYVKQDKTDAALADHKGHVVLLFMLPSLDTSTCAVETRVFNQRVAGLGAHVLVMSMDLPWAMKRFCAAEGITNVEPASDFRFRDAAERWGTKIEEGSLNGTLGRVTFVIDKEGVIRYEETTKEVGHEPDYDGALNAVKALL